MPCRLMKSSPVADDRHELPGYAFRSAFIRPVSPDHRIVHNARRKFFISPRTLQNLSRCKNMTFKTAYDPDGASATFHSPDHGR